MPAVLTQPTTTTKSTVSTGIGGFPPRTYTRADTGGGGGGEDGGNNQIPNWSEFQAPSLTESQYQMETEKGNQKLRGLNLQRLYQQCQTAQEAIATEAQKTAAQVERTRTATATVQLTQIGTQLVEAKSEVAKVGIAIEAEKWAGQQVKLGMQQEQTSFLNASRQGAGMLMLQQLQGMQLQNQAAASRNQHQQQLLDLQGWNGAALPPGEQPLTQSFAQQSFGGQARSVQVPAAFQKLPDFKLTPINGLGRRW